MLITEFSFCSSKVLLVSVVVLAAVMARRWAAPARMLLSAATFSCAVTERAGRQQACGRESQYWLEQLEIDEAEHGLLWGSVFSDPESVCINSHSQLETPLYYDSVDQRTLGTMNRDRRPDSRVNGLIG